jgi:hypothetical protein
VPFIVFDVFGNHCLPLADLYAATSEAKAGQPSPDSRDRYLDQISFLVMSFAGWINQRIQRVGLPFFSNNLSFTVAKK